MPKGWKVLVWYGAVHMDFEIYDNPQNFDPSRWNISLFFYLFFIFFTLGLNPFELAYKLLWIIGIKTVLNLSRPDQVNHGFQSIH